MIHSWLLLLGIPILVLCFYFEWRFRQFKFSADKVVRSSSKNEGKALISRKVKEKWSAARPYCCYSATVSVDLCCNCDGYGWYGL